METTVSLGYESVSAGHTTQPSALGPATSQLYLSRGTQVLSALLSVPQPQPATVAQDPFAHHSLRSTPSPSDSSPLSSNW